MNPLNHHPRVRRFAYYIAFGVGFVLGAVQVGYGAAQAGQPTWLTVSLSVYAFAASYLGLTAAKNTSGLTPVTAAAPRQATAPSADRGAAVEA